MPSPFPGMDPYLEAPDIWPDVHTNLATTIQAMLAPRLRPAYFVRVERRIYILSEDDPARRIIVPDVDIVPARGAGKTRQRKAANRAPSALLLVVMDELEVREPRLLILDARSRAVVTVLEILSPVNKTPGSAGREEYLSKRRDVLRSRTHLVEIDLLRRGARVPTVDPIPSGDYCVHVSRVSQRPRGEFFFWKLRDPLPEIPVPLLADSEAEIDLGEALHATYDRVGYDLDIDYSGPADPPLKGKDESWARSILGKRSRRR